MRALIVEEPKSPIKFVRDVRIDDPSPDEILVDVKYCGLCATDLHIIDGTIPFPMPAICGHEVSGSVAEVGHHVKEFRQGDDVVVSCRPACGSCYWCVRGQVHLCGNSLGWSTGLLEGDRTGLSRGDSTVYRGVGVAGFADNVLVKARAAVKIPPELPLDLASILGCGVLTGVGAVFNTARVEVGSTVLIVGLGGVGMSAIQGARIVGASIIIGVDPSEEKRTLAGKLGATHTIDSSSADVLDTIMSMTDGRGADYTFDTVGTSETAALCFAGARAGGVTVVVGVPPGDAAISVPGAVLVSTEKKISGCFVGSADPSFEIPRLIRLWESGQLQLEPLVTARRPIAELESALEDLKASSGLRTVLELD